MQCSLFHELRVERAGVFQHVSEQAACTRSHWGIAVCQHRLQQLIIFYVFTQTTTSRQVTHSIHREAEKRNCFSFIHNFLNMQYNLTKFGYIIHKRIVINAIWLIFELYTNLRSLPHKKLDVNITSLITVYKTVILCKETVNLLSNENQSSYHLHGHQNFRKFSAHVIQGRGLVLVWQQRNTLCTSSFVDDVMFSHNGLHGMRCWHYQRQCNVFIH